MKNYINAMKLEMRNRNEKSTFFLFSESIEVIDKKYKIKKYKIKKSK